MAITGRAVALCALGLIAVVWRPSLLPIWLVLVVVLVGFDLLLAPSAKKLVLQRGSSPAVRLGETSRTDLFVRNDGGRRIRGAVRDAWQPSAGTSGERHTVSVPGGETVRLTTSLTPSRRGDRRTDRVTMRIRGPLGLAERQSWREVPGFVRSLPAFPSRRHLPSRLEKLRQIDGRSAVRIRGQGTEFDSLRDYVDGDDVRAIDWRATARRQHPVVRTWQPERDRRIVLVLDTSRTSAGRIGDVPRLDSAMDAALLLTALASRAGDRVEFLAGDRGVRGRVAGVSDRSELLHSVVTSMAPLEPALVEADWTKLAGAVQSLGRRRALIVLLTPLEPAALEEGLLPVLPALTARHRVVLASVSDPSIEELRADVSSTSAVYAAAAAERTLSLHARTAAAFDRLGVHVLSAPPDELPVQLADHYLLLKRQGLL